MSVSDMTADDVGDDAKTVVVRAYGLLAPTVWPNAAEQEIALQTRLWNTLVEIDRHARAEVRAVSASDTEALLRDLTSLKERRAGLIAERKARRAAARSRAPTPDLDAAIEELRAPIAELAARLKVAARESRASQKEAMADIETRRRAAVKLARQQSNCWWGNYNAVCASYERGRQAAIERGVDLKFHRHDGSGRLTNQIQGGMSVRELCDGEHSQVQVIGEGRRRVLRATARSAGTSESRVMAEWPLIWHRDIPADARIKEVVVTRRRLGAAWRWRVIMTCTRRGAPFPAVGPSVAVDIGWRRVPEGVRVATWLRAGGGRPRYVIMPEAILDGLAHCDAIRGRRDVMLAEALASLRSLDVRGAPPGLDALLLPIRQAPRIGFGRVAALAIAWRAHDWRPEARQALESWRRVDKRLWLEEVNLRDKMTARRLDLYRNAAHEILDGAGEVVIDRLDLAQAARLETAAGDETALPSAARAFRVAAAPSEMRRALVDLAARLGISTRVHEGVSTWTCHECAAPVDPRDPAELRQRCPSCGASWDQDDNACRVMLAAPLPRAA